MGKSFIEFLMEAHKELPLFKMSLKAFDKDTKANVEKDDKRRNKLENQGRMIRMTMNKADSSK